MKKMLSVILLGLFATSAFAQIQYTDAERQAQRKVRTELRQLSSDYLKLARTIEDETYSPTTASTAKRKITAAKQKMGKMRSDIQTRIEKMELVRAKLLEELAEIKAREDTLEAEIGNQLASEDFWGNAEIFQINGANRGLLADYINVVNMKSSLLKMMCQFSHCYYEVRGAADRMKPLEELQREQTLWGLLNRIPPYGNPTDRDVLFQVFDVSALDIQTPPTRAERAVQQAKIKAEAGITEPPTEYDNLRMFARERAETFARNFSDECKVAYGGVVSELQFWQPTRQQPPHPRVAHRSPTFETLRALTTTGITRFDDILLSDQEKNMALAAYMSFLDDLYAEIDKKFPELVTRPQGAVSALRSRDNPQAVEAVCRGFVDGLDNGVTCVSEQFQRTRELRWRAHRAKVRKAQMDRELKKEKNKGRKVTKVQPGKVKAVPASQPSK
jgi:hypothetical protein